MTPRMIVEAAQTSNLERRCVNDVAQKNEYGDTSSRDKLSRAFAICRSSLQKAGEIKKGGMELTKKGAKRSKARRQDNTKKISSFERLVKSARKK